MILDGVILAIGNFDGVHKGHQEIIEQTKKLALDSGFAENWGVLFFSPHPVSFFEKITNYLLTNDKQKRNLLTSYGVQKIFEIDFAEVYEHTPQEFLYNVLLKRLNVKGVVTGSNFAFGKGRSGNTEFLENFAIKNSLKYLKVQEKQHSNGQVYSSSFIRECVREGKMSLAAEFMGHNFVIQAEVIHGSKLARQLGFPTANLEISNYIQPKYGVYVVKTKVDGQIYESIASFGLRPTIDNKVKLPILEVHIFKFTKEIYGKKLEVEFIDFIREEKKFSGLDELKVQISDDIKQAKHYFKKLK